MAKLENYTGSVEVISGMKQKNNGDFPLAEAHSIQVDEDDKRLDEALTELKNQIGNLVSKKQGTENSGKALIVDENGNVICGEAGVSADATLSEEGKAADAKATGDAISELKGDLENTKNEYGNVIIKETNIFTFGNIIPDKYIASPGSSLSAYEGWSVSDYLPVKQGESYVLCKPENITVSNVYYGLYDANKNFISSSVTNWGDIEYEIKTTSNTSFIRVSMASGYFAEPYMIVPLKDLTDGYVTHYIAQGGSVIIKSNTTDDLQKQIEEINSQNYHSDFNRICRSICRLGYGPYNPEMPPEQSIESYKLAFEKGFRIMLCDLQFTSDNIPVLWHDSYLNEHGTQVYKDGQLVDKNLQLYIKNMTYQELLTYDFGHYKGAKYDGTRIMTLNQMCEFCRNMGCELYIEIKYMSNTSQAKIACDIVSRYGLKNKTSWCSSKAGLELVLQHIPNARVGTMPSTINETAFNDILSLKNDYNSVFFFAWDTTTLTDEIVKRMSDNNIDYEMGNLDSGVAILNYFKQNECYRYCTGVNTSYHIVGKLLMDDYIKSL